MPGVILAASVHLLGAQLDCPVPVVAYCPPLDYNQVVRHLRAGAFLAPELNDRRLVVPSAFLAIAAVRGLLPLNQPPAARQRRLAATAFTRAWELQLWRDEAELLRSAIDNDTPLPVPYLASYAGRTKFFSFFNRGLPKWRHGRHAAVVPSEFASFLRREAGL
jgi:hypothetical protein